MHAEVSSTSWSRAGALCESTVTGFLRLVTNRSVYSNPASINGATEFVDALTEAPGTRWIGATSRRGTEWS